VNRPEPGSAFLTGQERPGNHPGDEHAGHHAGRSKIGGSELGLSRAFKRRLRPFALRTMPAFPKSQLKDLGNM
jgi:hypothetical protein